MTLAVAQFIGMAQDCRSVNPLTSKLKTFAITVGNQMQLIDCCALELPFGELLGELSESGLAVL